MGTVIEVDAQRLLCPMPVIRLSEAIASAETGDTVHILCTDPGVQQDIPAWCRVHGHLLLGIETPDSNSYLCRVEVKEPQ